MLRGLQEWTDRAAKVACFDHILTLTLFVFLLGPPPLHFPPPLPTAASVLKGSFSLPRVNYSVALMDPMSTEYTSLSSQIRTEVKHECSCIFLITPSHAHTITSSHPHLSTLTSQNPHSWRRSSTALLCQESMKQK